MEKFPTSESDKPQEEGDKVYFTRHSKATYATYGEIIKSDNPLGPVDPESQVTPDLNEQGVELAKQKAEKFFDQLDPNRDTLFFVSSNEARALETANIYRQVAKERGFAIEKPDNTRSEVAEEIGGGEIRAVRNLSLNIDNTLLSSIFNPEKYLGQINWDAVPADFKEKWAAAREIINADDKGSWGANFYHHSEALKEIFPELKSSKETYETQFKNILRLVEFGLAKASEAKSEKNIKILAFGHENYMGYALNEYFDDHEIANCETVSFEPEDGGVVMDRRGEKRPVGIEEVAVK